MCFCLTKEWKAMSNKSKHAHKPEPSVFILDIPDSMTEPIEWNTFLSQWLDTRPDHVTAIAIEDGKTPDYPTRRRWMITRTP
jgi:hypothetical protein